MIRLGGLRHGRATSPLLGRSSRRAHSTMQNHNRHPSSFSPNNNNGPNPSFTIRPVIFTASVCLGSFGLVAIWDYEKQYQQAKAQHQQQSTFRSWHQYRPSRWLRNNNKEKKSQEERSSLERFLKTALFALRQALPYQAQVWWDEIVQDPKLHTVGPIIGTNVALFGLLLLPPLQPLRGCYFVHHTGSSKRVLPMLLSTFAHGGPIHLFFNCYVLWSFGDLAVDIMGGSREQFYAAYISAGTLSSLGNSWCDYALRLIRGFPMTAGLGASGALYAVLFAIGLTHPEIQIGLVGLPDDMSLDAEKALKLILAFDLVGLVTRWGILGHGAHLSGAAAGYYAVQMDGLQHIENYQSNVVELYKKEVLPYADSWRN